MTCHGARQRCCGFGARGGRASSTLVVSGSRAVVGAIGSAGEVVRSGVGGVTVVVGVEEAFAAGASEAGASAAASVGAVAFGLDDVKSVLTLARNGAIGV